MIRVEEREIAFSFGQSRYAVSRATERKKAPEIRATKRSSVDFVRKMPLWVLVVKRLFN